MSQAMSVGGVVGKVISMEPQKGIAKVAFPFLQNGHMPVDIDSEVFTQKGLDLPGEKPDYLVNATRFKLSFSGREDGIVGKYVTCFQGYEKELDGRWVALVGAEDGKHLETGQVKVNFQTGVAQWVNACFGEEIAADTKQRNFRYLEESLELGQACGCTREDALKLVDYVFSRPVGEKSQEVGGVMVTLAALCHAVGLDMVACGDSELERVWSKLDQIRAKQGSQLKGSPLPGIGETEISQCLQGDGNAVAVGSVKKLTAEMLAAGNAAWMTSDGVDASKVYWDMENARKDGVGSSSNAGKSAHVDRGDAVNLARNIIERDITDITNQGVRILCDGVMRMDAVLRKEESTAELKWRDLALQFDGHRMQVLWHLSAMTQDPQKHMEVAKDFLRSKALPGAEVLKQRLAAMKPAARVQKLSAAQRVAISDASANLEFGDNFLGDVGRIIDLVETEQEKAAVAVKAEAAEGCEFCIDPDGISCVPIYGVGPHKAHTAPGMGILGRTEPIAKEDWPDGYTEMPVGSGMGVFWCQHCGNGKPDPVTVGGAIASKK